MCELTEPSRARLKAPRPRDPITITSAPRSDASSQMTMPGTAGLDDQFDRTRYRGRDGLGRTLQRLVRHILSDLPRRVDLDR